MANPSIWLTGGAKADFTKPECEVDLRVAVSWQVVMQRSRRSDIPLLPSIAEIIAGKRSCLHTLQKTRMESVLEGFTTVIFDDFNGNTRLTLAGSQRLLWPAAIYVLQVCVTMLVFQASIGSLTESGIQSGRKVRAHK